MAARKAVECEQACDVLNTLKNKRPGAKAISVPADLSTKSGIERLFEQVSRTVDHVDILLANAGTAWGGPFDTYPEEGLIKTFDLNVKSVFLTIQK